MSSTTNTDSVAIAKKFASKYLSLETHGQLTKVILDAIWEYDMVQRNKPSIGVGDWVTVVGEEDEVFIVDEQTEYGFVVRNAEGDAWHEPSNKVSRMSGRPEVKVKWIRPWTLKNNGDLHGQDS
jgi:hypothetical protein